MENYKEFTEQKNSLEVIIFPLKVKAQACLTCALAKGF